MKLQIAEARVAMPQADVQERLSRALGGKYRVLCHLDEGGMGQVYLAQNCRLTNLVAVKVLAEYLAVDESLVGRFEEEAETAAKLADHPNVVRVFDIGEGEGLHFFLMQFVTGENLRSFLKRETRVSPAAAANVIAQAAEGLSVAENMQVVHRDLKPANMLLAEDGRIRLVDFGISKVRELSGARGHTRPGETPGAPPYMSPEQIRGDECDVRSDLYSLGVVFFELLTGQRPFANDSVTGVFNSHLFEPPPSIIAFDDGLPPEWDEIVQKLLMKKAEDRFQNTSELLDALAANGVSSGPSRLRPVLDPRIRNVIEQAQRLARKDASGLFGTFDAISKDDENLSVTVPDISVQETAWAEKIPGVEQRRENHRNEVSLRNDAAKETGETHSGSKRTWLLVALAVLLAIGAGTVLLWTPHSQVTDGRGPQTPERPPRPTHIRDKRGEMVLVPAADSDSAQGVTIADFYIDESEVSNSEYRRFCEATGHASPATADFESHPDYPVTGVSHADASAYAAWAGVRLPTEQEWEKAARGRDGRRFPWGNFPWTGNIPDHVQSVISEPARRSPYGAYNMAGNVWEFTTTSYSPTDDESEKLKQLLKGRSFSSDWRVIKGGSFAPGDSEGFEITNRRGLPVDARSPWIGFRCVLSAATTH